MKRIRKAPPDDRHDPGAEADEIQLDLFVDYASNAAFYPAYQAYFREHPPRLLAIWGR